MSSFLLPNLHSTNASAQVTGTRPSVRKSKSHASLFDPVLSLLPKRPLAADPSPQDRGRTSADRPSLECDLFSSKTLLRLRLNEASTRQEWQTAATQLDNLEGNGDWKEEEESFEYDYELVRSRLAQMEDARLSDDTQRMLFLLRTSLNRHLGGMGNIILYKHSYVGTKAIIERYIASVLKTLGTLIERARKQRNVSFDSRHLLDQILQTRQSFGRSALLLSGGGTFGMTHIGVIKSLWEAQLLPRIISGASAGSIVCAVLCTRTDEDVPRLLDEFAHGDLNVFTRDDSEAGLFSQLTRFLKHGALFDIANLVRVMKRLLGSMTFQEAYNRTRRILNICVTAAGMYELPRLLNYVTAPNVIIWSAVAASCSVPFIFSAAHLLSKDPRTGDAVPWNPSPQSWIDGSVDNDLPMTRLAEMFNVNHFIVSQVNPHVIPFLEREEEKPVKTSTLSGPGPGAGPHWLHWIADVAKDEAMHRMQVLSEMNILPNLFLKTRSILNQKYSGDITICPAISYSQFPKVLHNPTSDFMMQATLAGERATWPKLSRIGNQCAIELSLDEAVQQLRARVAFSPSQVNLRLNAMGQPESRLKVEHGQITRRTARRRKTRSSPLYNLDKGKRLPSPTFTSMRDHSPLTHDSNQQRTRVHGSTSPASQHSTAIKFTQQDSGSSQRGTSTQENEHDDDDGSGSSDADSTSTSMEKSNTSLFPNSTQPSTPSFDGWNRKASWSSGSQPVSPTSRRLSTASLSKASGSSVQGTMSSNFNIKPHHDHALKGGQRFKPFRGGEQR